MGYLHDATDRGIVPEKVWAGTIATTATAMDDLLSVVIDGLDGHLRWTDCHWQPKDNITLPQRGDKCVVIMDDNGELWIVSWGDMPDVVNGKWVKGVGGAAVWTDIVDADVSKAAPRLGPYDNEQYNDYNQMVKNGWYRGTGGPNGPPSGEQTAVRVESIDGTNVRQTAYDYSTDASWMRRCKDGTWTAWKRRSPDIAETVLDQVTPYFSAQAKVQFGQRMISVGVGTTMEYQVPLVQAWPNQHFMFLCSCWAMSLWNGLSIVAPGRAYDLANGTMVVTNTVSAQNLLIDYMSIGY